MDANELYELIPAVYRLRDAAEGEPLRALVSAPRAQQRQSERERGALCRRPAWADFSGALRERLGTRGIGVRERLRRSGNRLKPLGESRRRARCHDARCQRGAQRQRAPCEQLREDGARSRGRGGVDTLHYTAP